MASRDLEGDLSGSSLVCRERMCPWKGSRAARQPKIVWIKKVVPQGPSPHAVPGGLLQRGRLPLKSAGKSRAEDDRESAQVPQSEELTVCPRSSAVGKSERGDRRRIRLWSELQGSSRSPDPWSFRRAWSARQETGSKDGARTRPKWHRYFSMPASSSSLSAPPRPGTGECGEPVGSLGIELVLVKDNDRQIGGLGGVRAGRRPLPPASRTGCGCRFARS